MRALAVAAAVAAGLVLAAPASGADSAPWKAASDVRQALSDAQAAIVLGERGEAQRRVAAAEADVELLLGASGAAAFHQAAQHVTQSRSLHAESESQSRSRDPRLLAEAGERAVHHYRRAGEPLELAIQRAHAIDQRARCKESALFKKYPGFCHHQNALAFLCDTLKVLLTGAVEDHHLSEILDLDLERHHEEEGQVPQALTRVADAMPGFGIVAAVLGVVITMGSIGGAASEIGEKVAAALVGTFLGILLSYGIFGPLATAIETRIRAESAYMSCIRTALLAFARGDAPMTCVEFARRNIEPIDRPSFAELEALTRRKAA